MNPPMQTGDNAGAIADFRKVLEISPGLSESLRRPGATQWRDANKGGAHGSRAQDLCRRALQQLVRFLRL
jgi:hypothetical protein